MQRAWNRGVRVPIGLCHGDVHVGNTRIADDVVTLFDFDVCGMGPLAYDLACQWRKCLLALEQRDAAALEWSSFLRGYTSVRELTDAERDVIPAFAALRAIWTMAMPTAFADVWGTQMLRDPTYFDAHLGMIRRLAALYGGRPGMLGMVRLVRHIIAHLTITGGMAAGDSLIQQFLGHGIASKLSARLGEGVLNGLMTARLGLAAIEVTRPLPFAALPRPVLSDIAGDLIRRREAAEK